MVRLTSWALALASLPAAASAQYIGGRAPGPPPAPVAGMVESPEAALARNIRLLAINPRDYAGLLGAGRAALRLGDAQAAIGFFGRAEEVNPQHWAPKAGQGTALAQMGDGTAALGMFGEAQRLGATRPLVALDRGLAFDLLGRQAEAQSDYRIILTSADEAEGRRRLALSLAISGRKAEALAALDPLLARRDNGARRTRAFILALTGDVEQARQVIRLILPGAGDGFDPFLRRLPTLGPGQKAAAVHLGMMPAEGAALAALEPTVPVRTPPVRIAAATPRLPARATRPAEGAALAALEPTVPVRTPPVRIAAATPRLPARATRPAERARLADIESTLSSLPAPAPKVAPPPAPKPLVERKPPAKVKVAAGTVTDLRTATQDARPVKLAAKDTKKKGEADKPGIEKSKADKARAAKGGTEAEAEKPARPGASRVYVQLAGGANADRMTREYDKIRGKKSALFRGRQPLVSQVKGWARLLVGPFKDAAAAQGFVNDLHAAKLEGFVWSAPGGTKFDKLAAK